MFFDDITMNFESHFERLFSLAQQDLSTAHIAQHTHSADLVRQLFDLDTSGPGAYSAYKPTDKLQCATNHLTGQKQWISNLPHVDWVVFSARCFTPEQVVLVKLDATTKIQMVPTVGMEDTLTAHLNLDHTEFQIVCDIDHPSYFFVRRQNSLAFVAIHYGLAQALLADLGQYVSKQKIPCDYHMQKLKLQLEVMQMVWSQIPKNIELEHKDHFFWKQKNIAYSFAKKCLLDVCQFATEITGSGIYIAGTAFHQRYKDALIYSSHMQNLYYSMQSK